MFDKLFINFKIHGIMGLETAQQSLSCREKMYFRPKNIESINCLFISYKKKQWKNSLKV